MGLEAPCALRYQGGVHHGAALLETSFVRFRGPVRLTVPFAAVTAAAIEGDCLRLEHGGETSVWEVGAAAAPRWLDRILHPKSPLQKLGVKAGQRVCVLAAPDPGLASALEQECGATLCVEPAGCDVVLLGVATAAELASLPELRAGLPPTGAVWVIYPKGVKSVTEGDVLAAGRAAGLTDVKVAAFSPTHTALRFVIPRSAR